MSDCVSLMCKWYSIFTQTIISWTDLSGWELPGIKWTDRVTMEAWGAYELSAALSHSSASFIFSSSLTQWFSLLSSLLFQPHHHPSPTTFLPITSPFPADADYLLGDACTHSVSLLQSSRIIFVYLFTILVLELVQQWSGSAASENTDTAGSHIPKQEEHLTSKQKQDMRKPAEEPSP